MSVLLKADNRSLVENVEYSYLVDNVSAGVSSVTVVNASGFSTNNFILIEDVGKEEAEIFRVGSINTTTGVITLQTSAGVNTTTSFAHPESTKVFVLDYDEVRFFHTDLTGDTLTDEDPSFDTDTPLNSWTAIDPTSWFSTYDDTSNSTGHGWFLFRNSITEDASAVSNPIPYAGFDGNTVSSIFEDFDSQLNVNELKLVTLTEKFSWLNEAISMMRNKLNLSEIAYYVSSEKSLSIVGGTAEYLLDSDFSDLVYINDGTDQKVPIPYIELKKLGNYSGTRTHYYLRGRKIGFTPTPTSSDTYKYRYRAKATRITSLSTYIDLPDNAFYALKSFMLYKAHTKFQNPVAKSYFEEFVNNTNLYIQASIQRTDELDSWEPAPWANV